MSKPLYPRLPVLIVDDEIEIIQGCEFMLESGGISNILSCQDSREVMPLLTGQEVQVVLLDLVMPHITGEQLLTEIRQAYPHVPIIILTGTDKIETAVACMKAGALDYLVKPVKAEHLIAVLKSAVDKFEERREYQRFKQLVFNDDLNDADKFEEIVTQNKKMRSLFQYVEAVSGTNKPVLITGESGVGKELIAKAVHRSSRRNGAFVKINIAGLDDNLFSDTLFGHTKGAFTGAAEKRKGMIEQASGGSLFLDEIGDLNPASQVKLLRLLEEGEFLKVGSDIIYQSNAGFIAATNQDIHELQKEGQFRTDLYFRFQIHHIHIPPLRERLDDLPLLLEHFLEEACTSLKKEIPDVTRELLTVLSGYHFPGNVRELKAMIFDAVSLSRNEPISMDRIREHLAAHGLQENSYNPFVEQAKSPYTLISDLPTLKTARRQLIQEALDRCKGNITKASRILGLTQSGLSKLLKREDL